MFHKFVLVRQAITDAMISVAFAGVEVHRPARKTVVQNKVAPQRWPYRQKSAAQMCRIEERKPASASSKIGLRVNDAYLTSAGAIYAGAGVHDGQRADAFSTETVFAPAVLKLTTGAIESLSSRTQSA